MSPFSKVGSFVITSASLIDPLAELLARVDDLERRLSGPSAPVLDSLLSPPTVAARLEVTERTLAEWRVSPPGTGPAYLRVGRGVRYRPNSVDSWLLAQEHASTVEEARA